MSNDLQQPTPAAGPQQSAAEPNELLATVLAYALHERKQETNLRVAFATLCRERHMNFHRERWGDDWTNCGNQVCCDARAIAKAEQSPELILNPLAIELMARFRVAFEPSPSSLRVFLMEKSAIVGGRRVVKTTAAAGSRPALVLA